MDPTSAPATRRPAHRQRQDNVARRRNSTANEHLRKLQSGGKEYAAGQDPPERPAGTEAEKEPDRGIYEALHHHRVEVHRDRIGKWHEVDHVVAILAEDSYRADRWDQRQQLIDHEQRRIDVQ